ncbi:MAG: 2-amino-4-oxopentanoate thiolase subunit OrtB [Petrotogales bacterium]
MSNRSYEAVMSRKNEIMKASVGIDYDSFENKGISFDYEGMMNSAGLSLDEVSLVQKETGVGNTSLVELKNINRLVCHLSSKGKGAKIFLKDEASNPSGSFKDRRASVSVYKAKELGYKGVIAATSGNYGAAVASQAVKRGLKCIVVQETYDSQGRGQPEILEKGRSCESYGAEVLQLTVGPELFYYFLLLLEDTGYFNASLYTPYGINGVETLGYELVQQVREQTSRDPDYVIVTNAGGGNLTGTARGIQKSGSDKTKVIAASVDLHGLHMASDNDFNKKSFTTGHTGFGIPFSVFPDRSDVPRNAARALRYMDEYYLVTQGEVFYVTEMLSRLEGMQRGPAGNISLAVAVALARKLPEDKTIVVQETEYTGAGKLPTAQLSFAKKQGIDVMRGNPSELDEPGKRIIIPEKPEHLQLKNISLNRLRKSYIKQLKKRGMSGLSENDIEFIAEDLKTDTNSIKDICREVFSDG